MRKFIVKNDNKVTQELPLSGTGTYFRLNPGESKEFDSLTALQVKSLRSLADFKISVKVVRTPDPEPIEEVKEDASAEVVEVPVEAETEVKAEEEVDYEAMTKAQLLAKAKELGKEVPEKVTKPQLIEIIRG